MQPLLDSIDSPEDVKNLKLSELPALAKEIRRRLVATVSRTGGHLASNLGVVELSIALHRVFKSPTDAIVFDVGHQCYTHKLLTGRRERFSTLRQKDGLSGFPKRGESEHDAFIAGHSGTSISAAIGLAHARRLQGLPGKVIAVIGDGSFSGLAFEGLNNVDSSLQNLIVVINDNEMSISKNVSPLAHHLARIRNTKGYYQFKDGVEKAVGNIPLVGTAAKSGISAVKSAAKDWLYHSNLFEDMGFTYLGPVDGHSLPQLVSTFSRAKALMEPVLIHVHTKKGRGFKQAEENPGAFHGVSKFDPRKEQSNEISSNSFSEQMGIALTELAELDERIVAATAAMKYATGLHHFSTRFRDTGRFFDVGIAESHAVIFSSAMAAAGMLPVFAVYSSFLQRAYDQILHDCSLEPTHLVLAIDRAGLVGEDGETHQGLFDVPFLCTIPGAVIYSPATYEALKKDLERALYHETSLVALRYPKGAQVWSPPADCQSLGDWWAFGEGDTMVVTYGRVIDAVSKAVASGEKPCRVILLERIFPLPDGVLNEALRAKRVVFVEECAKEGALGEHFAAALLARGFSGEYCHKAIENPVVPQGTTAQCLAMVGLDVDSIAKVI